MARIDLKNATIRLIDGYSNSGEIASTETPANGDTDFAIENVVTAGIVPVGTRFSIVGDTLTHYITGYNADGVQTVTIDATSGNYTLGFTGTDANPIAVQTTASIAFDATAAAVQSALEALAAIAVGDVVVTGADGGPYTIEFKGQYLGVKMQILVGTSVDLLGGGASVTPAIVHDGGTPWSLTYTPALATASGIPAASATITFLGRTLEVNIGDGNLTYSEKVDRVYELNRGRLDSVKDGDEQPMEVTMDFIWEFLTAISGAETPTIEDVLKQRGAAADWTSSSSDTCEPFAIDIEVEYVPPCSGTQREIITLPDFRYESLDHNFTDAQVSCQGKCNAVEAAVVRAA